LFLKFGLAGCCAQWLGFYSGIYWIADWNAMEPWTWIIGSFYMVVGSVFYKKYRGNYSPSEAFVAI